MARSELQFASEDLQHWKVMEVFRAALRRAVQKRNFIPDSRTLTGCSNMLLILRSFSSAYSILSSKPCARFVPLAS
jgi:hypothetical protein